MLHLRSIRSIVSRVSCMIALGCATPVDVAYDPGRDFSKYRVWDWIEGKAIVVNAPLEEASRIEAIVATTVERELAPRGLSRGPTRQLEIGAIVSGVRNLEWFEHTGAVETLSSHHDAPSFETQRVSQEVRAVNRCRFELVFSARQERRVVWRASIEERIVGTCQEGLEEAFERLVARYPSAG